APRSRPRRRDLSRSLRRYPILLRLPLPFVLTVATSSSAFSLENLCPQARVQFNSKPTLNSPGATLHPGTTVRTSIFWKKLMNVHAQPTPVVHYGYTLKLRFRPPVGRMRIPARATGGSRDRRSHSWSRLPASSSRGERGYADRSA